MRLRFPVLIILQVILGFSVLAFALTSCTGGRVSPSTATGSYRNPILPGFHPDPSIIRVGRDFYLATSTFEYFPGIPIYHSKDLIHWEPVGHVLTRESQLSLRGIESSGGIWAPTLRYHEGTYYVVTTFWQRGNYLFRATDPAGPWSDPVLVDIGGIDPSLFVDSDGRAYYTRQGEDGIVQAEIDLSTGRLLQPPRTIWQGTGAPHLEGPHVYKVNGRYYLLAAEGGTGKGHMVVVARSDSVWGPYESAPNNPILTHRHFDTHSIQATGHADLVQLPDGSWWAVFLAARVIKGEYALLGRETFLAPVTWQDGWPIINHRRPIELTMTPAPALEPVVWASPYGRDDFDGPALNPTWVFVRGEPPGWSLTDRPGWLCLRGASNTINDSGTVPAFISRRMEHFETTLRTRLDLTSLTPGDEAGIVFREDEKNHFDLVVTRNRGGRQVLLRQRVDGQTDEFARHPIANGLVTLEVKTDAGQFDFYVTPEGKETISVGSLAAAGVRTRAFTGLMVGMYASANGKENSSMACFDWFDYLPEGQNKNPGG